MCFSGSRLGELPPKPFENLPNLSYLDLSDCRLIDVSLDMLHGVTKLSTLNLSGNFISALSSMFLEGHYIQPMLSIKFSQNRNVGTVSLPCDVTLVVARADEGLFPSSYQQKPSLTTEELPAVYTES